MIRFFCVCLVCYALPAFHCYDSPGQKAADILRIDSTAIMLTSYAMEAEKFTKQEKFEDRFCFFADMHRRAADNRFLIYDLGKDSVETIGKVAHGRCNQEWLIGRKYSNSKGSGCSSLGKYRIGTKYFGGFGLAYKLYGLDSTNNNAFERSIVLHAHSCVPGSNQVPQDICQSDGCIMVAPDFLKLLASKISSTSKPVLLWVYDY